MPHDDYDRFLLAHSEREYLEVATTLAEWCRTKDDIIRILMAQVRQLVIEDVTQAEAVMTALDGLEERFLATLIGLKTRVEVDEK